IEGNAATLFINGKAYKSGDILMDPDNPNLKLTLDPKPDNPEDNPDAKYSITGVVRVAFTKSAATHRDTLSATGDVVGISSNSDSPGSIVITSVSDSDSMQASYQALVQPQVKIKVQDVTQHDQKPLAYTSFKMYQIAQNSDGSTTEKEVGVYTSDSSGNITANIKSGVYKLVETSPSSGYLLPSGSWNFEIKYDDNGSLIFERKADPVLMPYFGANPAFSTTNYIQGNVINLVLYNEPTRNLPSTGGVLYIFIIAFILLAIGLGLSYYEKPKEDDEIAF
ncbi:MAG: prealbumin-like fold domain-containing protein, partial [Bifidobacteriaceae bacterium]|nr:prealbumin-like fold domain-containing protein [Bifidobacteriaceae bacterium]